MEEVGRGLALVGLHSALEHYFLALRVHQPMALYRKESVSTSARK